MEKDIFNYPRTFRFDILTIFLSIFILSFAFVISFTYIKSSESILKSSKLEVERASALVIEKIKELVLDVQLLPEITKGTLENLEHPSMNNPELVTYMLDIVKDYPKIYSFYIAKSDGSYIEVSNLLLDRQTNYLSDPSKPLPKEALYSFRFIDRSKQLGVEYWEYKNKKLETVAQEEMPITFDPRMRPWYEEAKKNNNLFWTDVYEFSTPGVPGVTYGITVVDPVLTKSGELHYVIGLDLELSYLENFLAEQKIGKTGKAIILSRTGQLIIPPNLEQQSSISEEVIAKAFNLFSKEQKNSFIFKNKGIEYLTYMTPSPIHLGKGWLITIIVPLDDFFADLIHTQTQVTLISLLILIIATFIVFYFSRKVATPIVTLAKEIDKIRQLDLESKLRVKSNIKEIKIMDTSIAAMRNALVSFGRYVPKDIVKQLLAKEEEIILGGEKKEITVLFSDITGFTKIAETVSTDLLVSLLTDYFGDLSKIILEHRGTIDKYIGDSIMAFWNAPQDMANHVEKACEAALYCQTRLHSLNQKLKGQNRPTLSTRIGINTGIAFIGNIGTFERMNYTAIGDVVNTAQRLEQMNKDYHSAILISEEVYQKIKDKFLVRPLDVLMGQDTIYELMAKKEGEKEIKATTEQEELAQNFSQAFFAYQQKNYEEAREFFKKIQQKFPGDFPTKIYLERLYQK